MSRLGRALSIAASLLVGLSCAPVGSGPSAAGPSILFVGNSLTYTNDLPAVFEKVAEAAGDTVRVGMVAGPNLALIDHAAGATNASRRIAQGGWSFVVLQQGPTPAGICRDTLVIAAMRLATTIRQNGGRAVLFLPWTPESSPHDLGVAGESVTAAARAVGGLVVPVGEAWKAARDADPRIPLYGPDGYHPAPTGTLLAALTIYDRMIGRDVRHISATAFAELPGAPSAPAQLEILAGAAHSASTNLPADPPEPVLPDTTRGSPGGGPC